MIENGPARSNPRRADFFLVGKRYDWYTYIEGVAVTHFLHEEIDRPCATACLQAVLDGGLRGFVMTQLLERAFTEAGKLTPAEQDLLASRVLAELNDEDEFDRAIAVSADKLAILANEALAEHRAGLTQELDPDRL